MHGNKDRVVPYAMGVRLSEAIEGAKLVTVDGGGHNDIFALALDTLLDSVAEWATR
jgi:fermentation-respiration switch protein FrsA (DUF1100 family)